jgi:putative lumazine-binding protein
VTRTEGAISPEDREKILGSARDYIEGWLDGDAERMARCLHPALVKRESIEADPSAETATRDQMIEATAAGRGKKYERPYDVAILDAFGDIATVSVLSSAYMDYLHVARTGTEWLLLNVLWQRRPAR